MLLQALLLMAVQTPTHTQEFYHKGIIAAAKALDVRTLDTRLASQPLGEWFFRTVGPRADYLEWSEVSCGLIKHVVKTSPLCVRGSAKWQEPRTAVLVAVDIRMGTVESVTPGSASVYGVEVSVIPNRGLSQEAHDAAFALWSGSTLTECLELIAKATLRSQ